MTKVLAAPARESDASQIGPRRWRKHALPFTTFTYKDGRTVTVDQAFAEKLKANFDAGVRDIVPVPAKGAGGHSDDWRDSKGNTIGLEVDPVKGLYVTVEVDEEADKALAERKLGGVSLAWDENYVDPITGESRGPVLRHTALTNLPYIKGTDGFEKIALSDPEDELILLSEIEKEDPPMDLKALQAALKKEHGIDLDEIQGKATKHDEAVAAQAEAEKKAAQADGVRKALAGAGVELSEDAEPADAIKVLVADKIQLSERLDKLEAERKREKAEAMVKPYAKKGLVAEAQREKMIALAEADPELAQGVLSGLSGGVLLSEELGSEHSDEEPGKGTSAAGGDVTLSEDDAAEIERLKSTYVSPAAA